MRVTNIFLLTALLFISIDAKADSKIKYYFNYPVDNSVYSGTNAIYLNHTLADTIVAYINRSKYSIDIAQYDYNQSSSYADISVAINNAYSRGVKVRWIYDGSSSNTGIALLNAGIHTLASPTSSAYNIMHDKIVIVDANSTNPDDAYVLTGSADWSISQFDYDYNNEIIFQDSALAHAYTAEFNMMWGDTGITPNSSLSKFGQYKTDLGRHNFTIDGKQVELYFSPSDGTDTHIQSAIASANTDLYLAMYTFTDNADANAIVSRHTNGIYVAAIIDQFSNTYSSYSTLSSAIGSNLIEYTGSEIYHNKYLIVDPSDVCSDPQVLTGSHNWSISANTKNDENTVIVHDATAANIYYQAFHKDFTSLGGTFSSVSSPCPAAVTDVVSEQLAISVVPNPSTGDFTLTYSLPSEQHSDITLLGIDGKVYGQEVSAVQQKGSHSQLFCGLSAGIYLVRVVTEGGVYTSKIVVE